MSSKITNMKEKTVIKYMNVIHQVCSKKIETMKDQEWKIGGKGTIVEIDEIHLAVRKYQRGTQLVSEHFWVFGMIEVQGGWVQFEDESLYKRLIKSEKEKIIRHATVLLDKKTQRKQREEKKPKRARQKVTMAEFKMLVKDILNTDLHRNYEGDIEDVYDIITMPTVKSDEINLKDNPLTLEDKKRIETMFSQRRQDKWTGKALFFKVETRSEEELLPIILKHVHPDSIIMSDKWAAYNSLPAFFESYSISHKYRFSQFIFKKGELKALRKTTNHIERCWVDVRRFVAGAREDDIQMKLDVETFRYLFLNSENARENMVRFLVHAGSNE